VRSAHTGIQHTQKHIPIRKYLNLAGNTGWQRCIGCLMFMGHFPQKSPEISGSFEDSEQQLKAAKHFRHPVRTYTDMGWLRLVGS